VTSAAYARWASDRRGRIDALLAAYDGGAGAAEQLRWSLVLLLAAEFQGYARDLHDEVAGALLRGVDPVLHTVIWQVLVTPRLLDRANAGSTTLHTDFDRLGVQLAAGIRARFPQGAAWLTALDRLIAARNAVAHSDPAGLRRATDGTGLHLGLIGHWYGALVPLARAMDSLTAATLANPTPQEAPS
jgi:hypothetical protein